MFGLAEYFRLYDLWSPLALVASLLIIVLYVGLTGFFRDHFPNSTPVSFRKRIMFVIGIALLYYVHAGPIHILSHIMFMFHMIMMAISCMIVPPLLLLAVPSWLWRFILIRKSLRYVNWVSSPLLGAILFNTFFSFYHIPIVHNYVMTHYVEHIIYDIVLFSSALLMWWPIIEPVSERARMTDVKKMGYIFLNSVLITPACTLIIFAEEPLYATYVNKEVWIRAMGYCISGDPTPFLMFFTGPDAFNWFSPLEDQQIGAIVMKLFQEMINICILFFVFIRWFQREGKNDDVLTYVCK